MSHKPLKPPKTAQELFEMYFLDIRCALLETASAFDRIERAEGADTIQNDPRFQKLVKACKLIPTERGNRAEQFLKLFSE